MSVPRMTPDFGSVSRPDAMAEQSSSVTMLSARSCLHRRQCCTSGKGHHSRISDASIGAFCSFHSRAIYTRLSRSCTVVHIHKRQLLTIQRTICTGASANRNMYGAVNVQTPDSLPQAAASCQSTVPGDSSFLRLSERRPQPLSMCLQLPA